MKNDTKSMSFFIIKESYTLQDSVFLNSFEGPRMHKKWWFTLNFGFKVLLIQISSLKI